jgi:hypothetical protein
LGKHRQSRRVEESGRQVAKNIATLPVAEILEKLDARAGSSYRRPRMTARIPPLFGVVAALAAAAQAGDPPAAMPGPQASWISGQAGISLVSQYFSRGSIYENQGVIAQPYLDLSFRLHQGRGALTEVSLNVGFWSSIHSRGTDAGLVGRARRADWYEFDATVGMAFTLAEKWTLEPSFLAYYSPNNGFDDYYAIQFAVRLDDRSWLGWWSMRPQVQVLYEVVHDGGAPRRGWYFEAGVSPGFGLGPASITFPLTLGLGARGFYESLDLRTGSLHDEAFGFFSAGVDLEIPISAIPEEYGKWTFSVGAAWYYLGAALEEFNTPRRDGTVRDVGPQEWLFHGGLAVEF